MTLGVHSIFVLLIIFWCCFLFVCICLFVVVVVVVVVVFQRRVRERWLIDRLDRAIVLSK